MSLAMIAVLVATSTGPMRVFIDPGHGVGTNSGTRTVDCEDEQAVNLRHSRHLARHLKRRGYVVKLARRSHAGPSYKRRARAAKAFAADVLISVHADSRGAMYGDDTCPEGRGHAGFAVLWSDEGEPSATEPRARLARALARRMAAAGLTAYDGADYGVQYEADRVPGSFRDRRGLFMLRRPAMPSLIIETHHALIRDETAAWKTPARLNAFAKAVEVALRDYRRSG